MAGSLEDHMLDIDVRDCILLFLEAEPVFRTAQFGDFIRIQHPAADDEQVNESLLKAVEEGDLREIGPGVYARATGPKVPMEEPLWPEDASG